MAEEQRIRVLILGVGNLLLRDEGIGVHVVQALSEEELPVDVEVVDAGTSALDVLTRIEPVEKMIVVDAVRGGSAPGTIYRFTPEEVQVESGVEASLHEIGLMDALNAAKMLGSAPKMTVIIGVEPAAIEWGTELSAEVGARIPEVLERVRAELQDHGDMRG